MTDEVSKLATLLFPTTKAASSWPRRWVAARLESFPHLDPHVYARLESDFAARGFRHLGDLEDIRETTVHRSFDARTLHRAMLSPEGEIVATFCQLKRRRWRVLCAWLAYAIRNGWRSAMETSYRANVATRIYCDLTTEFGDGHFLVSISSWSDDALPEGDPPNVECQTFPDGLAPSELLAHHARRLQALMEKADGPGRRPRRMTSLDDTIAMDVRLRQAERDYAESIGWYPITELEAITGDRVLAEMVQARLQSMAAERART